jgi:O-antigen/teichoic acid export membrane protein
MVFRWPLVGIPLSVLTAEALKAIVGFQLARKHLHLKLRVDWSKVRPVLRGSFAFYVNAVALVVVNRFDINVLKVRADDREIGLYSAASELAQMTFVMTPMLGGVVAPLFARTLARGREEYARVLRRTLELVLIFAFPASLAILVGADFWVRLLLGTQYAASAWALSILGPSFLLTYVAVIVATALNLSGGEWTVTVTSLFSLVLNPVLVLGLVALSSDWGVGGGGAACAMAAIITETVVLLGMFWRMGRTAFDARLVKMLVKTTLACAVVVALDRLVLQGLGYARLLVDAAVYAVLVTASGALSVKETVSFVRSLRAQRAAALAAAP